MSTLQSLRDLRSSVEEATARRDDAIQALVSAVAILAGEHLPIRTLLEAAGISKQTYYLRLERGRTSVQAVRGLGALTPLKAARATADEELLKALDARTREIANVVQQFSAREIAEAAGVSEVWVRKIRRRTQTAHATGSTLSVG